jgi:hypothetical protein
MECFKLRFAENSLVLYGHTARFTDKVLCPNIRVQNLEKKGLEIVVKVDYIKTRPLKARMFARLCEEMG